MELDQINHFLYVDYWTTKNIQVHVATLCNETPICLKLHSLVVGKPQDELEMIFDIKTEVRDLPYLKWNMKIQDSKHVVSHKDDIVSILKKVSGTFGVWGPEQFEYANQFWDNLVDVKPLLKKALRPNSVKTISDLYLEIIHKFNGDYDYIWKCLFKKDYKLWDIDYFVFYEKGFDEVNIYTATTDFETPVCLKICDFRIDESLQQSYPELLVLSETLTEMRYMTPLDWKMKIQNSWKHLKSKTEMEEILQKPDVIFGVWGKDQYDYFREFLVQVVDVTPLIMKEVSVFKLKAKEKKMTNNLMRVSQLFLEILRKRAKKTENFFEKDVQREFQEWIENEGWKAFFRKEDNESVSESSCIGSSYSSSE